MIEHIIIFLQCLVFLAFGCHLIDSGFSGVCSWCHCQAVYCGLLFLGSPTDDMDHHQGLWCQLQTPVLHSPICLIFLTCLRLSMTNQNDLRNLFRALTLPFPTFNHGLSKADTYNSPLLFLVTLILHESCSLPSLAGMARFCYKKRNNQPTKHKAVAAKLTRICLDF